mmetsp:Transcript_3650/g.4288  ORF Transcript_3650/g.4288 Transcript_3650/m.4288 type:complete len:99 (-) Transcript_3650:385-681(-)
MPKTYGECYIPTVILNYNHSAASRRNLSNSTSSGESRSFKTGDTGIGRISSKDGSSLIEREVQGSGIISLLSRFVRGKCSCLAPVIFTAGMILMVTIY